MKDLKTSLGISLVGAAIALACWGCSLSSATAYSCGAASDRTDQELIDTVTKNLPMYRFKDYFDGCDSGGGRGVRFVLSSGTETGIDVLRSRGCEVVADWDPEFPNAVCEFDGMRVHAEIEDPDIWVVLLP